MSDEPYLKPTASGYRVHLHYGEGGHIVFEFDDLETQRDSLHATVNTWIMPAAESARRFQARIDLRNLSNEATYRRHLQEMLGKKKRWIDVFNEACRSVVDVVTKEDQTVNLADVEADTSTQYIVPPLVLADGPTVHFGRGGSGKTYVALAMAVSMASRRVFLGQRCEQGAVLFVDYEATPKTTKARLQRIVAGLGEPWRDDLIHYWEPHARPLPDILPALERKIREENIRCLLVDSAGLACGGNPKDEDVALRYFNSLARLGIPSLTIAHVTKKESDGYPYGSIFWSNSARLTWYVKLDRQEGSTMWVSLFNRKSNETQPMEPLGVRLDFSENAVAISREGGTPAPKAGSDSDRLLTTLQAGPRSVKQLSATLTLSESAVRMILNRLKQKVAKQSRADDNSYRWALAESGPK